MALAVRRPSCCHSEDSEVGRSLPDLTTLRAADPRHAGCTTPRPRPPPPCQIVNQRLFPGSLEAQVCSSVLKTAKKKKKKDCAKHQAFILFLLSLRWVVWLLF